MREFRGSVAGLYVGLVGTLLASTFPGIVVYQLVTGVRLMVGRRYNPGGIHPMTALEMVEFGVLGSCLVAFGLFVMLDWKNSVFQTTSTGIRKLTTLRKVEFSADWGDLRNATKRKGDKGQTIYAIATADRELVIPSSKSLAELRQVIMDSAPQVNYSHWRRQ